MLLLSSYERLRRYLADTPSDAITDSIGNEQAITTWITSVSKQIETWLRRTLEIDTYTEYFRSYGNKRRYWVRAYPISAITSVCEDSTGEWDGSESAMTDYHIGGEYSELITLDTAPSHEESRGIRAIYTGGLSSHGTQSVFAVDDASGLTAGYYVRGSSSQAYGKVVAASAESITIEIMFGVFDAGDTLTEYTTYDGGVASGQTCVIESVTRRALAEEYPDIVQAAEMQIRYYWKHKDDFEVVGSNRDATNLRRQDTNVGLQLTKEPVALLMPYRRPEVR